MKKLLLLSLLCCFALSLSAQQTTQLPKPGPESKAFQFVSDIQHNSFHSEILGVERNYSIYLPKSYKRDSTKYYPVLYLLHGMNEADTRWANIPEQMLCEMFNNSIAQGSCCDMIIVFPDAGTTHNGYFNCDGWMYEDYFFKELVPYIESHFRVKADKGHRAIGGLSMGGGGSCAYALRHPEMFCAAYPMSAALAIFGENSMDCVRNSTDAQKEQWRSVKWFLDCGDDDFLLDWNMDFYKAMKEAKIPCQFRVRDGGHTSFYWYQGLSIMLPWVSSCFSD
jgi:enterochelin esterase-like enzyme